MKKDFAKQLFLTQNLTQQEIADKVEVNRITIARWIKEGKWEELKVGMTLGKEEQIQNLHRQVAELNRVIADRPEGQRFATPAEIDTLKKMSSTIRDLEGEVGLSDIISVGTRFLNHLRPVILHDELVRITQLFDGFVRANTK